MKTVKTSVSSFIKTLAYSNKTLSVEFITGRVYSYKNVPVDVAARFAKAKSKGRFYNKNIIGSYESERVV